MRQPSPSRVPQTREVARSTTTRDTWQHMTGPPTCSEKGILPVRIGSMGSAGSDFVDDDTIPTAERDPFHEKL
jgi:hypothetical protein